MTIPEISKVEGLTQPHVAKLMMILRKEGFIKSTRGQTGGYTLARPPRQIAVGEVLNALGGKLYDAEFCGRHAGHNSICTHAVDCSVRSLWQVLQTAVDNVVDRLTLEDLMAQRDSVANVQMFSEPRRLQPISSACDNQHRQPTTTPFPLFSPTRPSLRSSACSPKTVVPAYSCVLA